MDITKMINTLVAGHRFNQDQACAEDSKTLLR